MAGKASTGLIEAMRLVVAGVVPYTASQRTGIHPTTMYRSRIYKAWLAGEDISAMLKPPGPKPGRELGRLALMRRKAKNR